MSGDLAKTRRRLVTTVPAGLFLLLCLLASLGGAFVTFCVALVLLAIVGAENTPGGVVFVLIAISTGLVLPTVFLRKSRRKHRQEIVPDSFDPRVDPTAVPSRVQAVEKSTELTNSSGISKTQENSIATTAADASGVSNLLIGTADHLKIPNPDHGSEKLHHTPNGDAGTLGQTKPLNRRTRDNRSWLFPACALGFLIIVALLIFANKQDSSNLEVELSGAYLTVRNIGTHPIRLLEVSINDRTECEPKVGLFGLGPFEPTDLKVGNFVILISPCISIVRTTLRTEAGSWTYSFAR
jgi:hypothetical protein